MSNHLNGFEPLAGCTGPLPFYGKGYGCDLATKARRLNIWSNDMGQLELSGKGYDVDPVEGNPVFGANAGRLNFDSKGTRGGFSPLIRTSGNDLSLSNCALKRNLSKILKCSHIFLLI